jgi:membrane-bound ClpP family serine protease
MSVSATFDFIAYTVPAIMVLGGILLLILGYPTGISGMIEAGWGLIITGALIYVLELALAYSSNGMT